MKLVNLVPLKEIDFRNQDQFDNYIKQHELRPDTKVTIAGKVTTAGQAVKNSEPVKGTSVFGKDKGGSVFGKSGGASTKSDKITSKPFDADTDTKDFANALPKGFSEYSGGTIDGVTSFGDDNGNNVFVSDPSVYDDEGNYAVSGYNDDDMTNTNYKSFEDKQQAIEYAKQLATKLSGSTKLSEMIPTKIKK